MGHEPSERQRRRQANGNPRRDESHAPPHHQAENRALAAVEGAPDADSPRPVIC